MPVRTKRKLQTPTTEKQVEIFKKRILKWDNPVEFVNNMYGCHPNDDKEYLDYVFGTENK